jgi:hypothetical protein
MQHLEMIKDWTKWKGVCKGVKLWPPNIIVFKEVKLKEQGQVLRTPKKTTFICLFFYNFSNNSKISHKKKKKKVGFVIKW